MISLHILHANVAHYHFIAVGWQWEFDAKMWLVNIMAKIWQYLSVSGFICLWYVYNNKLMYPHKLLCPKSEWEMLEYATI